MSIDVPAIEVRALHKRYGSRVAVRDVSFTVQPGEVFGLLGPNGAGKTTTLSMLSTLLAPDGGHARIYGCDVLREQRAVKRMIGLVPQDLALYPTLSARANLEFFGSLYGLRGATLRARVGEVLDAVGLSDRARDAVGSFSGGMKRRINIAAGMIHRPRVLFLDEPTVGVDPQSRNFIFDYVEQLKAAGMTVIYTTHYMEEAERLCDRIAIVNAGEVIAADTPRGLIGLLGGGLIRLQAEAGQASALSVTLQGQPGVRAARVAADGRLDVESHDVDRALVALVQQCAAHAVSMASLEVLKPNLESVFLHLTGKRLRDE